MIFEVCIDSIEGARLAKRHGANRVELCAALSVGGLTPSIGLAKSCVEVNGPEVHVMIRNREGNFEYNIQEVDAMLVDVERLSQTGITGVVFGCLTEEFTLDLQANKRLFDHSKALGLEVTFHRAFDFLKDSELGLKQLIDIEFDRLLTSGNQIKAIDGLNQINRLVACSNRRIEIMAGSGVNASNAIALAETGIDALHFTSHTVLDASNEFGMGQKTIPNENKIQSIMSQFS